MNQVIVETRTLNDKGEENLQSHTLDTDGKLTCLVHQQGIQVDVKDFVEINPEDTLKCIADMNQAQWEWISTGALFKHLWKESQDPGVFCGAPEKIEVLQRADKGLQHLAGLIILSVEAAMAGQKIFLRTPETHLHPANERYIASLIMEIQKYCGGSGNATATKELGPIEDIETTIHKWLECIRDVKGPAHLIAEVDGKKLSTTELLKLFEDDEGAKQKIIKQVCEQYSMTPPESEGEA